MSYRSVFDSDNDQDCRKDETMKKIAVLCSLLVFILSFVGCSSKIQGSGADSADTESDSAVSSTTESVDGDSNDRFYEVEEYAAIFLATYANDVFTHPHEIELKSVYVDRGSVYDGYYFGFIYDEPGREVMGCVGNSLAGEISAENSLYEGDTIEECIKYGHEIYKEVVDPLQSLYCSTAYDDMYAIEHGNMIDADRVQQRYMELID